MLKDFHGTTPRIHHSAYVSDQALVIGDVLCGADVSLWPSCVIRGDVDGVVIGDASNLQDAVLVHTNHDLPVIIGSKVTIGHGAIIHGCRIGDNCLIGMGAIILDGARIGDNCIIGAGALVTEHAQVPPGSLVVGVPGKVVRQLTFEDKERIAKSAEEYIELARLHRRR